MISTQTKLNFTAASLDDGVEPDMFPARLPKGFLFLDTEHENLGRDAQACGVSLCTEKQAGDGCWYWPFGHKEGRQHEPANVRRYLKDQLVGRDIVFRAAKNDIEVLRRWGLDLEGIGVKPHEVQHAAALLDDRRRKFDLETLMMDRFGRGKVKLPFPSSSIASQPARLIAEYAREDARGARDLWDSYMIDIKREDLERVLDLEDRLIYATMEMERNGFPLDIPKLEQWKVEIEAAYNRRVMEIFRRTGLRINPNSGGDMAKLLNYLGIHHGNSFTDPILEAIAGEWVGLGASRHFEESCHDVQLAREARQLDSLLSKYVLKYLNGNIGGMLYYQLHQLRADEGGTITGRYASSGIQVDGKKAGGNIQQVMKPSKQDYSTIHWIIRELFLPASGRVLMDADASQIEFRLFAHYSNIPPPHSDRLIKAYNENPELDFHQLVTDDILQGMMERVYAKNWNFRKLYGGGVNKSVAMTGLSFERCAEMDQQYDELFPEATRLLKFTERIAEGRKYIKTFMGRRRRFYPGDRFYSALNCILQGGAAELMKLKLIHLYNERKTLELTLRATVHDEALGDLPSNDPVIMNRLKECFAAQEFKLRIPITWDVDTGENWFKAGGEYEKIQKIKKGLASQSFGIDDDQVTSVSQK